ncbi:MAG TPA: SDR family oxidoreductase [Usitatibacter sp.]|nr:SDR family oxidoreductase [Usitatibacter sp.]
MRLRDKVALVTGAAQGIGLACATAFAREGAKVVLADVNEVAVRREALRLHDSGAAAVGVHCDVSRKHDVQRTLAAALDAFGRIDVLVANAGITHAAEFLDVEEEDFDRVIAVNLKGVFLVGQAVGRQMARQGGGGAIINMSSVNAVLAIPNQVPYVASKGGVSQLTKVMALALAPHAIRVNAIGPGTILTEMARDAVLGSAQAEKRILSRTPLGRMGAPEEVARVAVFLASDDASYMTGQTIYPDGGRLALNYTVPVRE